MATLIQAVKQFTLGAVGVFCSTERSAPRD